MGFRKKLITADFNRIHDNFFDNVLGQRNSLLYRELCGISKIKNIRYDENNKEVEDKSISGGYHWEDFALCFLKKCADHTTVKFLDEFMDNFNKKYNSSSEITDKPHLRIIPTLDSIIDDEVNLFTDLIKVLRSIKVNHPLDSDGKDTLKKIDEIMYDAKIILFGSENKINKKFEEPFEKVHIRLNYMSKAYFAEIEKEKDRPK